MSNYTEPTFGAVPLNIESISVNKVPSTVKQKLGKDVVQIKVIGRNAQDWSISINGFILGSTSANLSTNRAALETLDDADIHAYVDGIHDGNYIIDPESLQFSDDAETHFSRYKYQMKLIQKT